MSKLYNALERLEQIAEEQSDDRETARALTHEGSGRQHSGLPRRTLLFSLILFILGILVLALLYWGQHIGVHVFSFLPGSQPNVENADEAPVADMASVPPGLTTPTGQTADHPVSPSRPLPIHAGSAESSAAPVPSGEQLPDTSRKIRHNADNPNTAGADLAANQAVGRKTDRAMAKTDTVTTPPPGKARKAAGNPAITERRSAMFSRWLLQAEQRRREGDWAGAARLYRLVWDNTKNPAVANNLAASLLHLGRAREARAVLVKALQIVPEDRDLLLNLELADRALQQH